MSPLSSVSAPRRRPVHLLALASLSLLAACGGGGDTDASQTPSTYLSFAGSSNGESVVDAQNNYVKFRANTRIMEVAGVSTGSDITIDNNNNLVKSYRNVGKVQLVAGTGGTSIAGLVATDGTMLEVRSSGSAGAVTLVNTDVRFAAPGSGGSGSGSGSGSGGGSGSLQACAQQTYPGDTSDPQVYLFDKLAQFDGCAYRATGESAYLTDGNTQCRVLNGLLQATNSRFKPLFCNGASLKY